MGLFANTNIDFLGKRKYAYIFSGLIICAGIVSLVMKGGPKLGLDFTGGTLVQLNFEQNITNEELRSGLDKIGFDSADIQSFVGTNSMSFRTQKSDHVDKVKLDELETILNKNFEVESVEVVGPTVGAWLIKRAILAFILAFIGIIIYVGIRFHKGVWGLAGVVALVHDVLIVVSVFSIFNKEMTMNIVAALMTIVGYSINDTIVIFDRIRENLLTRYKENIDVVINDSINQTLSRTIITTVVTLFTVVALLIFGGEVLRDFSFALFIGMIAGTYSTLFIAVPLVVDFKKNKK